MASYPHNFKTKHSLIQRMFYFAAFPNTQRLAYKKERSGCLDTFLVVKDKDHDGKET